MSNQEIKQAVADADSKASINIQASKRLQEEMKKGPGSASCLLAAAKIQEMSGKFLVAAALYEQALAVDSNIHEARARLALSLLKSSQKSQGLEVAVELINRDTDYTFGSLAEGNPLSAMTVLGDALRANGQEKAALEAYGAAFELQSNDAHAAKYLYLLQLAQGKGDETTKIARETGRLDKAGTQIGIGPWIRLALNDSSLPGIREVSVDKLLSVINSDMA